MRYDSSSAVHWTLDGKAILFNGGPGDRANVYRQPVDGSGPATKVTHFTDQLVFTFSPARDGRSVLVSRVNLIRDAVLIRGFN